MKIVALRCVWMAFALAVATAGGTGEALAGATLEAARARGSVVVAAVPDELPLAARGADGRLEGFDIEVAEEIGRRLGLPVTFVTPAWSDILAGDWGGRWDLSVSSITPTEARARFLDFPSVYRYDAVVVVAHIDNQTIATPADASGRRVGVKAGTTFERYLRRDLEIFAGERGFEYVIDQPQIRTYLDKGDAVAALSRGDGVELDAVVTSFATARSAIGAGAPIRILPGFLFWEPVAVAIAKADPEWAAAIDGAVSEMLADGTLSRLSAAWFGMDMTDPMMR